MSKILGLDGRPANGKTVAHAVPVYPNADLDQPATKRDCAAMIQNVGQQIANVFSENQKNLADNDAVIGQKLDEISNRFNELVDKLTALGILPTDLTVQ